MSSWGFSTLRSRTTYATIQQMSLTKAVSSDQSN